MLKSRFFYTVFVTCIIGSVWQLLYRHSLDIPSDDFALLASLDQKKYESIILALEPYKGTMLAANFLGDVELYSVEESYFPRKEYRSYEVNAKNPLLTTQDSRFALAAIESTKLSDRLVLVSEARAPDNVFYFSSRARSKQAMKLASKGIYDEESWGAWSQGHRTELTILMSKAYRQGGTLLLEVLPATNPNSKTDERHVILHVDDKPAKRYVFASSKQVTIKMEFSPKEVGSLLSVVIEHVNPISFSELGISSDWRQLSLGFVSAELVGREEAAR